MKLEACELDVSDVSVLKSGKEVVNKSFVFNLVCIVEIFDCHDDEVVADHLDVAFVIIFFNSNLNGANAVFTFAVFTLSEDSLSDKLTVVTDFGISLSEIVVQKSYFAEESDIELSCNIGTFGHCDFAVCKQLRFAHLACDIFEAVAAVVICLLGQAV